VGVTGLAKRSTSKKTVTKRTAKRSRARDPQKPADAPREAEQEELVDHTTHSDVEIEQARTLGRGLSAEDAELKSGERLIQEYQYKTNGIPIRVRIIDSPDSYVPLYIVSIAQVSETTAFILERIRKEIAKQVSFGMVDIVNVKKTGVIEERFKETIDLLLAKYFPDADEETIAFLKAYLIQKSLGLGDLEIVMSDGRLEEIAINASSECVWVYHREHGWLRTNVYLESEEQVKHYASIMGRKVGRQITVLEPLMDANLAGGDRVNATLQPISLQGNTITLRKVSDKPWTITDFLEAGTIDADAAALIWLAIQYELSALVAGGTASGKTSMLNVVANFFPPSQRILTIEDTHEIRLPSFLHWVPMITRLPNPEGKGGISMLHLLVNALRQRPDRILVGEVRRAAEAEVLFEAIHTGHSVYATIHANSARETITRLTNPPIEVPKTMLPALSLIIVQYRNRRTGKRRTFQVAEIKEDGTENVLMQYSTTKDRLETVNKSVVLYSTIELYTGLSKKDIDKDLADKKRVLEYLVKKKINTVESVGRVMAEYYTNPDRLFRSMKAGKTL
jgi:archaeal flagellar protein FlaI